MLRIVILALLCCMIFIGCDQKQNQDRDGNYVELERENGIKVRVYYDESRLELEKWVMSFKQHGSLKDILSNHQDELSITLKKLEQHVITAKANLASAEAIEAKIKERVKRAKDSYELTSATYEEMLADVKKLEQEMAERLARAKKNWSDSKK